MSELEDDELEDDVPLTVFGGDPFAAQKPVAEAAAHYLVQIEGTQTGKRVEVGDAPVTLGRDAKQTLVFASDGQVSRLHARVSLVKGKVVAEDVRSTNGTFVNSERLSAPIILEDGDLLRVGQQVLRYERRSRRDVERAEQLSRDLQKASNYVLSLLPAPIASGPVHADWFFQPSTQLGGDAFGYYWLDSSTFVFYLVDVSGHGVGSAMHSVTVMNVLRQRALPGVDFRKPGEVLASLNDRFQMDTHNGLFFTIWYGVYHTGERTLAYSSAGHHPAFLVPSGASDSEPLGIPALMIGIMPDQAYEVAQTTIAPGSTLYLFSDGVFEIVTKDGTRWEMENFLPLLAGDGSGAPAPKRLFEQVRDTARPGDLDDDFSLMSVTFP